MYIIPNLHIPHTSKIYCRIHFFLYICIMAERNYKEEKQIDTNKLLKEFEKEANERANIQSTNK